MAFVLLAMCLSLPLAAQTRKELVDKRKRLIEEIRETETSLKKTQEDKEQTLTRFFALQNQIQKRQLLVTTLRAEIEFTHESIERTREVLASLEDDIVRLKREYAGMLRTAYRQKVNQSFLLFLFSANGLNDAFRRWQYLRQYDRFRRRQADLIAETQHTLEAKTRQLEQRRLEKEQLLLSEQNQKELLGRELQDKDRLLKGLKSDESRLVAELERQRRAHEQLNSAIETIIQDEMARKRKAARTTEALAATGAESPGAAGASNTGFEGRKGSLPWPVNEGEITRYFGTQSHPSIKTVKITNNGIDIRTEVESNVFAVYDGQVAGTQYIPGYQYMIILQHGTYYTVYSNLEEIYVKRGDRVSAQEPIGRLGSRKPEVHFEVWREKERLDPTQWVNKP